MHEVFPTPGWRDPGEFVSGTLLFPLPPSRVPARSNGVPSPGKNHGSQVQFLDPGGQTAFRSMGHNDQVRSVDHAKSAALKSGH